MEPGRAHGYASWNGAICASIIGTRTWPKNMDQYIGTRAFGAISGARNGTR